MNIVIVIDAWNKWPLEDTENFPTISKEARAFGSYINTMLNHIRELDDTKIIHYTWSRPIKLMDQIQIKNDRVLSKLGSYFLSLSETGGHNLYACGFHYGICVESVLDNVSLYHRPTFNNFGLIDNLTLRHPRHSYSDIKSKYDHYYYTPAGGFELMDVQLKDTVV